jgi:hypothetical protein
MKYLLRFALLITAAMNLAALSMREPEAPAAAPEIRPVEITYRTLTPAEQLSPARSPLLAAFDVDGDNVLSAAEIANAARVLRSLDANGDGILTADEFPRP